MKPCALTLERLWELGEEEFIRRTKTTKESEKYKGYQQARDETFVLTEEISKIEQEIDERVRSLYGL